jgi:anti-sigma-K factor RskA
MPIPASGTTVAITVEPEGGSKQPTSKPIVEVDPATL